VRMEIRMAIGIVDHGNGSYSFVDPDFAYPRNRLQRTSDIFQSFGVVFRRRNADSQPAFGVVSDVSAMPHLAFMRCVRTR